jgi:hypothetical protein
MGGLWDFTKTILFGPEEPQQQPIVVTTPAKSQTEIELLKLQKQILQKQAAGPTPEERALIAKQQEYYEQLIADETLSDEERAEFEKERDLQLSALEEKFGIESERYGGKQLASLVHRGILESTTGEEEIAQTQERFTEILGEQKGSIMEASEIAKSDFEAAKRQMAGAGYRLTSGMSQSQTLTALEAASGLQNYMLGRGGLEADAALTNAIVNQQRERAAYEGRMSTWKGLTGLGMGLMKAGFGGGR